MRGLKAHAMVPDFYAILEIDSRADRATVEAALETKRRVWSSGTRNPKYKHTYQSYLDQVPEVRRCLLGDPTARSAYDAELNASRQAERTLKLDELQRLVRLRSAKGGLTVTDRSLLRERTKTLGLESSDLDRLIEAIPPRPESPIEDDDDGPTGAVLESVMRRQINSALGHVRRKDLYDALQIARDAPLREIKDRADEERERWMRKTQVTAEKTAWLEVISYAQSQLSTLEDRERYDRTLVLEAEELFLDSVRFTLEGLRTLDSGTRSALLDDAASRGIPPDRAEKLVRRVCKEKGVVPGDPGRGGPSPPPPKQLRCRRCNGLNDFGTASKAKDPVCRFCRESLQWSCPGCQRVNWVDEQRCRCKLPIESVEPLIRHFEAAQKAHKDRHYDTALFHLQRVLELSPGHVGARKGIGLVEERRAQVAEARSAYERARARRRILAARASLVAWSKLVAPGDPDLVAAQAVVNDATRDALEACTRAKLIEATDPRAARQLYSQALAIVADLAQAREGLMRCPPDPPTSLSARFEGDRVILRWTAPPQDDLGPVAFIVCRNLGEAPASPTDGQRLAQVTVSEFEDRDPPHGERLAYSVFAVRGLIHSIDGARSPLISVLPEVANVEVESRSREVLITWHVPARAGGVKAYRRDLSGGPEVPIEVTDSGCLLDRNLEDDRSYRYRISVLYPMPDGRLMETRGREVVARPHRPIEAAPAPAVSLENGVLTLRWTPPPLGRVKIVRSSRPLPISPGITVPASRLESESVEWLDASRSDSTTDPAPPALGVCHYTPVTQGPDGLTLGHSVLYSSVPDPTDLRAVRVGTGGRVHLRWRWSPRATESIIVARAVSPPSGPDDDQAIVQSVLDSDYSRQGFATFNLPTSPAGPWHLAVFTAAQTDGGRLISPGLEVSARTIVPGPNPEVTLSYTLRRQGFPAKAWTVTFRTDPPGASVPPTVLVAHPRTVPLTPDDGESVERFPASLDGTSFAIKPKLDLSRHRVRLFADPTVDPEGLPPIRIRHPESTAARV